LRTRFTFRQLEYFVAVGEAGGIARAAERISVSSPTISAAIADLENEFDIQLFVRQHAQGLTLTPGGRRFLNRVKSLLADAGSLHELASDIAEQVRGPITLGCLVTLSPFVLPELRRSFEQANPEVAVSQVEAHQAGLFNMLRRAEIDAAITYDLELPSDLSFESLVELPPYALFHPDHPMARRRSVSLEALAKLPLVLLDLPLSREYFLSLFQNRDLRPSIAERTSHIMMVRSMVANGFGYGLLNIPSLNEKAPDGKTLRYVPLSGKNRPMVLGLATVRSERKSRVLTEFENHCRTTIRAGHVPGMALLKAGKTV
jgi:DNA-binding transcriptional LysR family regulator